MRRRGWHSLCGICCGRGRILVRRSRRRSLVGGRSLKGGGERGEKLRGLRKWKWNCRELV